MNVQNARAGIGFMVLATIIFSVQDALSRYLAGEYNVLMVVMIRYWFFAGFVILLAVRAPGGIRAAFGAHFRRLQMLRGILLALQICVLVMSFTMIGLVGTHAIFACYTLVIAALSWPVLGERVGWRRWSAIAVGFVGILVILQPGADAFTPGAGVALLAAVMFAIYGLLTRYVARRDQASVSFFWTGIMGAVTMTVIGIWAWEPMAGGDLWLMAALCVTGASGHYCLIKAYDLAEASAVQPFAYLQLVFASGLGIVIFDEVLTPHVAIGAAIVVAAGLFTLWRQRVRAGQR
jgi:drug/metabolite transporter (DMT)-like permease